MDEKMSELAGALIGLVRATDGNMKSIEQVKEILIEGLFAMSGCLEEVELETVIEDLHAGKAELVPGCMVCGAPCGRTDDYDIHKMYEDPEEIRLFKKRILHALKEDVRSLYVEKGKDDSDPEKLMNWSRALFAIGERWGSGELKTVLDQLLPTEK